MALKRSERTIRNGDMARLLEIRSQIHKFGR
jgi:hypothetical protein